MRITRLLAPLLCLTGLAPHPAAHTSSVGGPRMSITPEVARVLFASMAADLRNLVTAQENYFADHNSYSRMLSTTNSSQVVIRPSQGVTLTLTYVTANTWTGRANHEWLGKSSCVIAVGKVAASRIPRTATLGRVGDTEGSPVCDER